LDRHLLLRVAACARAIDHELRARPRYMQQRARTAQSMRYEHQVIGAAAEANATPPLIAHEESND
jgi:hypothetical protein